VAGSVEQSPDGARLSASPRKAKSASGQHSKPAPSRKRRRKPQPCADKGRGLHQSSYRYRRGAWMMNHHPICHPEVLLLGQRATVFYSLVLSLSCA
jgi:hypothetical protein